MYVYVCVYIYIYIYTHTHPQAPACLRDPRVPRERCEGTCVKQTFACININLIHNKHNNNTHDNDNSNATNMYKL